MRETDRMPAQTVEQVKVKVEALRKALARQGESMDGDKRRSAVKQLRRAQRKHRRLAVVAAASAAKIAAGATKSAAAETTAEPTAEPAAAEAPEARDESGGE